jgi:hypothetical protein
MPQPTVTVTATHAPWRAYVARVAPPMGCTPYSVPNSTRIQGRRDTDRHDNFPNKLSLSRFTGVLEGGQSGSQAVGLGPQIRSPRGGRHRNGPPYRVMAMVIVMEW